MNPIVDKLLALPEPAFRDLGEVDYGVIAADDAATVVLLDLLRAPEELEDLDDEQFEHVRTHARRALGARGEMRFLDAFVEFLRDAEDDDDDWYCEDFPRIMAKIGVETIPPLLDFLSDQRETERFRAHIIMALDALCQTHDDETADRILDAYAGYLDGKHPTRALNGFVISTLIEMGAARHAPVVREAYLQNRVDVTINGDLEEVEVSLGIRTKRETERPNWTELEGELSHKARLERIGPAPASDDPLTVISYFLALYGTDQSMFSASHVDGFLLACVSAPQMILPSQWIPLIWDVRGDPKAGPVWESAEDAAKFNAALMALCNANSDVIRREDAYFNPVTVFVDRGRGEQEGFSHWAAGILAGLEQWILPSPAAAEIADQIAAAAYRILETESGEYADDAALPEVQIAFDLLGRIFDDHRELPGRPAIAPPRPHRREIPKVGRNDPCPCGSGRKYKKCCMN